MKSIACAGVSLVLGIALLPVTVPVADAGDTAVTTRKIKASDRTQPGMAERKVRFASLDPNINIPAEASAGDPTIGGGSLELLNTNGTGESMVITLPSENWSRIPRNPALPLKGWRYKERIKDLPNDTWKIIKVVMKQNVAGTKKRLKAGVNDNRATGTGGVFTYTLDEATQGSLGIRLVTGTDRHCADSAGGELLADESRDLGDGVYRGVFAVKEALAPPDCGS